MSERITGFFDAHPSLWFIAAGFALANAYDFICCGLRSVLAYREAAAEVVREATQIAGEAL